MTYLSNTAALSLLYAHISRALALLERNKIGEAQSLLLEAQDAVAEPMKAMAEVEADFAELMGAMPTVGRPMNPISQCDGGE